jgi:hypothetical protein
MPALGIATTADIQRSFTTHLTSSWPSCRKRTCDVHAREVRFVPNSDMVDVGRGKDAARRRARQASAVMAGITLAPRGSESSVCGYALEVHVDTRGIAAVVMLGQCREVCLLAVLGAVLLGKRRSMISVASILHNHEAIIADHSMLIGFRPTANVRLGSLADIAWDRIDVRCALESGHPSAPR